MIRRHGSIIMKENNQNKKGDNMDEDSMEENKKNESASENGVESLKSRKEIRSNEIEFVRKEEAKYAIDVMKETEFEKQEE